MDEWIKMCIFIFIHTHKEIIISAMRKKEILPFVTIQMDLEGIMLSEISQTKTNTV